MYTYCFVNDWIRYSLHSWLVKLLRPSEELEEVEQSLKDSLRKPLAWKVVMLLRTMGGPFSSLALHELGERAVIILLVWRGWFREWHDPRFDPGFHVSGGIVCVCIQWQEESSKQKKFWSVAAQDWAQGPLVVLCLKGLEPPRHRATKA